MANDKEITIKVQLDGTKGVVKDSTKVKSSIRDIGDEAEESGKQMKSGFSMGAVAAGALAAGALNELKNMTSAALRESYRLSTAVEETASKYQTVLGPSVGIANEFLEQNTHLMGLSRREGQEMVATTTAIAQGFGFQGDQAAELGTEVVKLAGDLQSFNDVPIERTHNAITTALSGEREALKSLGIVIRETDVQQRALEQTGKDAADAITQQEKATATLSLITERAGKAVGDLERTQDSTSNKARRAAAEYRTLAENLSTQLLPAFDRGVDLALGLARGLNEMVEVPVVEELKAQKEEFNALYTQATNVNTSSQERLTLIRRMKEEYPEFLEGIDAEKVSNQELAGILEDVNDAYNDRINIQQVIAPVQEAYNKAQEQAEQVDSRRSDMLIQLEKMYRNNTEELERLGVETDDYAERIQQMDASEAEAELRKIGTALRYNITVQQAEQRMSRRSIATTNRSNQIKQAAAVYEQQLAEAREEARTQLENLGFSQDRINDLLGKYNLQTSDADSTTTDYASILQWAANTMDEDYYKGLSKIGTGTENLSEKIKKNQERITELINKSGDLTEAEREELRTKGALVRRYEGLLKVRKKLTEGTTTISVEQEGFDDFQSLGDLEGDSITQEEIKKAQEQIAAEEERRQKVQKISQLKVQSKNTTVAEAAGIKKQSENLNLVKEDYKQILNIASQGFQNIAGFLSTMHQRRIQDLKDEKEQRLENINAELQQENISEERRKQLIKERQQTEKKFQEEIEEAKAKQFRLDKAANIARATSQTALAVIEALPNIPLSIAVGAIGAGQIATIAAQPNPYFMGGQLLERLPEGKTSPGQKTITINETGKPEYIVNAESTRRAQPLLDYVNASPSNADRVMKTFSGKRERFQNGGPLGPVPQRPDGGFGSTAASGVNTDSIAEAIRTGIEDADIVAVMRDSLEDLNERLNDLEEYNNRIGN